MYKQTPQHKTYGFLIKKILQQKFNSRQFSEFGLLFQNLIGHFCGSRNVVFRALHSTYLLTYLVGSSSVCLCTYFKPDSYHINVEVSPH